MSAIMFENIRPFTAEGIRLGSDVWKRYQLSQGRDEKTADIHIKRFDTSDQEMEGNRIHKWMRLHKDEYRELGTGEINCTLMAEDCALELFPNEILSETHEVWDIAVDIFIEDGE